MSNLNEFDIVRISNNDMLNTLAKDVNEVLFDEVEAKEIILWVDCPSYEDEVTKITYEDVTDSNGVTRRMIKFHFTGMGEPNISSDLMEWSRLVTELSEKEIALYKWKECYKIKSDALLEEAKKIKDETGEDIIKKAYGGNNDKTRKAYVKDQLSDWDVTIHDLEFSISYIIRRISYLKELVRFKRTLMEVKE